MLTIAAELGRQLGSGLDLRVTAGGNRTLGEFDDRPDNAADTLGFGFASQRDSRANRGNLEARVSGALGRVVTATAGLQVSGRPSASRARPPRTLAALPRFRTRPSTGAGPRLAITLRESWTWHPGWPSI